MVVLEKIKNKRTQGRQKIEIKKLEKKSNKQVTFSKRRSGIFKKAGELSLLCGSEVAVIVFSPNGKLFCFGHPSVDVVIRRYLHGTSTTSTAVNITTTTTNLTESADMANGGEFNMRTYVEAVKELEAEKKRVAEAKKKKEGKFRGDGDAREGAWWDDEVDGMGVEELEQYMAALSELRKEVASKVQDLMMVKGGSPLPMASFREGNGRLGFGLENGSF